MDKSKPGMSVVQKVIKLSNIQSILSITKPLPHSSIITTTIEGRFRINEMRLKTYEVQEEYDDAKYPPECSQKSSRN